MNHPHHHQPLLWLSWSLHAAGLGTLLLGAIVGYYVAVQPFVVQQAAMEQEVEHLTAKVQQGPEIRREHQEATLRVQQFRERMDAMRKRIPDEPCEAEFLTELAELATQQNVAIQNYQRGNVTDLKEHVRLGVELTLLASYPNLCRFLDELGRMRRISTVEKLEIRTSPTDDILPVHLSLVLYYTVASDTRKVAAR